MLKKAKLYSIADTYRKIIECEVCENRCRIPLGKTGICGNYKNIDGSLYHVGYGKISAVESRPIEIKPLFHYWPNSTALTFSNLGCNFHCPWCQNYHLSFRRPRESDPVTSPEALVEKALQSRDEGLCASFNEPTTNYDYLIDVFTFGHRKGLYATMVTNGYLTHKALEELIEVGADGWSIDIKGCPQMREKKILPHVDHEKVYRNAKRILDLGGHVEMVYLVVTDANDHEECYKWIIGKHVDMLGPEVPLHVNRYYPVHKWIMPPTPLEKLEKIADYARREGIEHVYIGNTGQAEHETTRCPRCGKTLIVRRRYRVTYFDLDLDEGRYRCPRCGHHIPIRGRYISGKTIFLF
ncbi:MAG: radical SAM protein [Thermoprotei archaeon]|nr:MAG: radical SAM protein [Thermoprotei archaeon]